MAFDAGDDLLVERLGLGGDAEGAVVHVTPGTAGDLADLLRPERADADSVELVERRERGRGRPSMFRPMPIASVATRKKSTSPF